MNKVLFVCGMYAPKPSANGVCVIRLQEVFRSLNIESDVICIGDKPGTTEKNKYGNCYYIREPKKNSKNPVRNLIQKIFHFFSWPLVKESINQYKISIKKMTKENNYDLVIAVCQPVTAAFACAKFYNGKYVLYELDSITNIPDTLHGVKKMLSNRINRIEKFIYLKAMYIFHTKCDELYYSKKKYDAFSYKWEFTDIPHLVKHENTSFFVNKSEKCIAYTGLLTKERNDPEYFLQLITKLSQKMKIKAYFTSHGDCENMLINYNKRYPNVIIPLGFVSFEKLQQIRREADAFISLGLRYGGEVTSVQSKIFEYMSTGKQIVHIIGSKNDVEKDYLKQYGNALLLSQEDDFDENVEQIYHFLCNPKIVDPEFVRKTFPMNTPEWTVNRMIDIWSKNEKDK